MPGGQASWVISTAATITTVADSLNASIAIVVVGFKVTIDHSNTHVVKLCQLVKGEVHSTLLSLIFVQLYLSLTMFSVEAIVSGEWNGMPNQNLSIVLPVTVEILLAKNKKS